MLAPKYFLVFLILITVTESLVSVNVQKTRSIYDASPRFDQSKYSIHVRENEEPRELITLRAFHRGISQDDSIVYSIMDEGTNVPFYLDETNGQLVQLAPLDSEKNAMYIDSLTHSIHSFHASACLSVRPSSCAFTTIQVIVDDVNDNSPFFVQRDINVTLSSDVSKGTQIAHFEAFDKDSGGNGRVSYAINPPSNTFAIDIDTGDVITLGPLEDTFYELAIQAFDDGTPRKSDIGRLRIDVEGSNPSVPQFDQSSYEWTLDAPVKEGQVIGRLHATDPDPGLEGFVTYRLAAPDTIQAIREHSRFSINKETGTVTSLTPLSSFDGPFVLVVEASDNSPRLARKTETLLRIHVQGEPLIRFLPLPSTLFVSSSKSSGSVILRAFATSSSSSPVSFTISPPSQHFGMKGSSLIVLNDNIPPSEENITIVASSEGKSTSYPVRIVIMQNREKFAVFPRLSYQFKIPLDSSFPLSIHKFNASLVNSSIIYSLFPATSIPKGLHIHPDTGELTIDHSFISSNDNTLFTVVRATNSLHPQFFSDVGVILHLEPSSSKWTFPLSLYRIVVRENTPVGTLLNTSVSIPPKSPRVGVEYGVIPSDIIAINANGSLYVSAPIDIESLPVDSHGVITYTIWAESGDERILSKIDVKVIDENEFGPRFTQKTFRLTMDENGEEGSFIGRVTAEDEDGNDELKYSIGDNNEDSVVIVSNGSVYRGKGELHNEKVLDIVVTDKGGLRDTATLEIEVISSDVTVPSVHSINESSTQFIVDSIPTDISQEKTEELDIFNLTPIVSSSIPSTTHLIVTEVDRSVTHSTVHMTTTTSSSLSSSSTFSPPRFIQNEYSHSMSVDTPIGFPLLTVSTSDENAPLYSSNCSFITITQNGILSLSRQLKPGQLYCSVTATNEDGQSSIVPLRLSIQSRTSINHPPQFDRNTYNFNISTDSFASMLGKLNVFDVDGDNLTLTIQPPQYTKIFDINSENELELRYPASTLSESDMYSFIIIASDDAIPHLNSTVNVNVRVHHGYKKGGFVPIASSVSTLPLSIPIPTLLSPLQQSNVTSSLPQETHTDIQLVTNDFTTDIPISENGNGVVEDVHFSVHNYSFTISRDLRVGMKVGKVQVEGIDEGSESIEFILGDDRILEVNEEGEITLKGDITHPFNTSIIALLNGRILDEADIRIEYENDHSILIPSVSTSTSFPLIITTEGDIDIVTTHIQLPSSSIVPSEEVEVSTIPEMQGPSTSLLPSQENTVTTIPESTTVSSVNFSFCHNGYTGRMSEGGYKHGSVVLLNPSPLCTNGKNVEYSLVNSHSIPFSMNSQSGQLVLLPVDREEKSQYVLIVNAIDHSTQSNASTTITVDILDINDNYPFFITLPPVVGLRRNCTVGTVIGNVIAMDEDDGTNGQIVYSLLTNENFSIDPFNGTVTLKKILSPSTPDQLLLYITATDKGIPSLKTEGEMEIRLFPSSTTIPVLPLTEHIIYLAENAHVVGEFLAGPNDSEIKYSVTSANDDLFIISDTGTLSLGRKPKEEEIGVVHNVEVQATNVYGSDRSMVRVMVQRNGRIVEGGKKATCSFPLKEYRIQMKEKRPPGQSVVNVTSDCEERGIGVKYSMGIHSDDFTIDPSSGEIITIRELNGEEKTIHLLVVNVTEDEKRRERDVMREDSLNVIRSRLLPWQTLVIVEVLKEKNQSPKWKNVNGEGKIVAVMKWNMDKGSPIVKIHDYVGNEVKYSLQGTHSHLFSLNSSGILYVNENMKNEDTHVFSLNVISTQGSYKNSIPLSIYRLSPSLNLLQLTIDNSPNQIDLEKMRSELRNITKLNIRFLAKQTYRDENGMVDPMRSHVFVYALDSFNVPIQKEVLISNFSEHKNELKLSTSPIASFASSSGNDSISFKYILLLVLLLILLILFFVSCCIILNVIKRRRGIRVEEYMGDDTRPRPYDVDNIDRVTARNVFSSRRIQEEEDDRVSPTSNRSDTTFIFANSVKDDNSYRASRS